MMKERKLRDANKRAEKTMRRNRGTKKNARRLSASKMRR
jgi:hypothetical protein